MASLPRRAPLDAAPTGREDSGDDTGPVRFPDDCIGLYPAAVGPVPMARLREELTALYQPPLRAPATLLRLRQTFRLVAELGGVETTADLTPAMLARFIQARTATGEAATTTMSLLRNLRVICGYAADMGYVRVNPFALRKRWFRVPKAAAERKHHAREDIARVLDLLRVEAGRKTGWPQWRARRLYALAALFAFTGLRRNEGLYLTVGDIDLAERIIEIRPRVGGRLKTEASAQPVPIPEPLAPILADWLAHRLDTPGTAADVPDGCASRPVRRDCPWVFPGTTRKGPWVGGSPGDRPVDKLRAAGQRAGVEGLTFLSLRHSFATHAELWGLSETQIQRILRHTTTRTAREHYRHADNANLRAMVRGVSFTDAPPADRP
jgi:integrase